MFANYENLILAVLMSLLSGTGVFLHGIREQRISASLLNLATEWVIALIAGLTGFYVAKSQGLEESLLYIVVLVSSNNGREITSAVKTKLISVLNGVIGGGKGGANNG